MDSAIKAVIEERLAIIAAHPGVRPEDQAVVIAETADLQEQLDKASETIETSPVPGFCGTGTTL